MSVIVTLSMRGDPAKLEQYATSHEDAMHAILERAKGHGAVAHRFYGSDDGRIMVADEWPDQEAFNTFFAEAAPEIQTMFGEVGITAEPEVSFWHKLDTHDDLGWSG